LGCAGIGGDAPGWSIETEKEEGDDQMIL
jgi:hypothetical protein